VRAGGDPPPSRRIAARIRLAAAVFAVGFAVVTGRAVQLQVLRSDDLASQARDQYVREIELKPRRGPVLDRNGVTLAADVEADSVFLDPEEAGRRAKPGDAARLARALGLDPALVEQRLARGGRFVWLKRRVSPAESDAARALKLPFVGFVKEFRRYYPGREVAGQLLGAVGESGEGIEGVERMYEDVLKGEPVRVAGLRDARGALAYDAPPVPSDALVGGRVELTIDQGLQSVAEAALARMVEKSRALAGVLVAMDPETGEILALANAPLYNPNSPARTPELMKNRAVLDTFEPGSTMKAFTLAGALEAKVLKESDEIDCEKGRLRIGRHVVNDSHAGMEVVSPAIVLASSSNVGTAKIGQRLGRERLRDTLRAFGFGERQGLGFPGEPRGVVALPRAEIALATMSFGQGMTASPLQVTTAMAALANGGVLMKPILVKRVVERRGTERGAEDRVVLDARPTPLRRVVSAETAATMQRWLEGVVVAREGTGKRARLERWRAAGKTGTAQKVDPITKTYSRERFASFVGFAPMERPRIVVGVFVDEPKGQVYGSELGAPVFREVVEWAMKSYGVPPSEPLVDAGDAHARPLYVEAGEAADPGDAAPIELEPEAPLAPGSVAVPSVEGLGARPALRALERAELAAEVAGSGRVASQAPAAGQVVPRGTTVRVVLAPPG
jgi:cell division protein FtsI (penicillin-binding protein 3)